MSPPTIIEIFQSQGCSACPPTYSNLLGILTDQSLKQNTYSPYLLLTYHVTYWDHLGWKDTFAKQLFNDRQHDYVKRLSLGNAFTPQIVVGGRFSRVVKGLEDLKGWLVKQASNGAGSSSLEVSVEIDDECTDAQFKAMVKVSRGEVEGDLDLWSVVYDPRSVELQVLEGENGGRMLS